MKKIFLLLLIIGFSAASAQQKYYIFLKDKGAVPASPLMKTSSLYKQAESLLTPKAIERRKAVMGDDYITYEDLPLSNNYISEIESLGIKIQNKLKWFNAVTAYLTGEQKSEVENLPFVKNLKTVSVLSEPDVIPDEASVKTSGRLLRKSAYNLDYGYSLTQDELEKIPEVHDLGFSGKGVLIGLLDTGFRWKTHPALQNKDVVAEFDFVNKDYNTANEGSDASDQDSHGTGVFSIIGGYDPGNLIGPAYGASYLLAKTEYVPTETHVEEDNYAAALEWMENQGVDITSSSLGYNIFDTGVSYTYADMNGNTTIVAKAANLAFDRGVSTFTAAGNEGSGSWYYLISPGDAFNIITVGSVTSKNILSSFSSHGPTSDGRIKPEVVAMGSSVFHATTTPSLYGSGSGTSYATPIAAGVGALLKSAFPNLTNMQIRQIFIACGDHTNTPDNNTGYGLISALKAITYPNFSYENLTSIYTLHKICVDSMNIPATSITLHYKITNDNYKQAEMQKDGNVKFAYSLPVLPGNAFVEFYFEYTDSQSNLIREPANGQYNFVPGSATMPITEVQEDNKIPSDFVLEQNFPNPFNPETTIKYSIPAVISNAVRNLMDFSSQTPRNDNVAVSLKVYDVIGREVATLVNGVQASGNYEVKFDGKNLPSGVYFYKLHSGSFTEVKKMILMK